MTVSADCFQNLLLATDFSESAAVAQDTAIKIARRCGAKLTIAHVVPDAATSLAMHDYVAGAEWVPSPEDVARVQKDVRDGAEQGLRQLVSEMRGGLDLETDVLILETDVVIGAPYASIIDAVKQRGFDLVVVGTRGMSAIKRVLVGSTATRLARACPAPVWVARQGLPSDGQAVLAAVDFSPVSERIVSISASLAAAFHASLHVVHVYDTEDLSGAPSLSEQTRAELSRYRRQARRAALGKLEQLLESSSIDPSTATLHVAQGVSYQVINSTARRLDAGLIVMGSVGRRGISALLIGNTAEKVLHTLDRSLLVIKPTQLPEKGVERQESTS